MVRWEVHQYKNGGTRLDGHSDAETTEQLLGDCADLWMTFFSKHLSSCDRQRWNSILGAIQVWHGSISLSPCLDLSLMKQCAPCSLYVQPYHDAWESIDDDEVSEQVANEQQAQFVMALSRSIDTIRSQPAVSDVLDGQPLPFKILIEPDEPFVFESVLR